MTKAERERVEMRARGAAGEVVCAAFNSNLEEALAVALQGLDGLLDAELSEMDKVRLSAFLDVLLDFLEDRDID